MASMISFKIVKDWWSVQDIHHNELGDCNSRKQQHCDSIGESEIIFLGKE